MFHRSIALVLVVRSLAFGLANCQTLIGELTNLPPGAVIVLWETRGQDHVPIDSARTGNDRRFRFEISRGAGFYQISVNDTDRVELILDPRERSVEFAFDGTPLREHITVRASAENMRLWEYKRASRAYGLEVAAIQRRRASVDPRDAALLDSLARIEETALLRKEALLERLLSQDSTAYFHRIVRQDQRLMAALPGGARAVRDAFAWSDPRVLRSAVYPKGIMAILQTATPATTEALWSATDSVLAWAAGDTACWSYAREFLLRVFTEYNADELIQHVVDEYIVGARVLTPPGRAVLDMVAEQLSVAVGSSGRDVLLPTPGSPDTTSLHALAGGKRFTCLFFYSSTCDHCHEQMPGVIAVNDDLASKGVQVIGIALDADASEFHATRAERKLSFACFSELNGWGSKAAKAYAVKATPSFILLDSDLRIVAKPHDHEELRRVLVELLDQR